MCGGDFTLVYFYLFIGQVKCPEQNLCIEHLWLCDGEADCDNGWDESPEVCKNCSAEQFQVLSSLFFSVRFTKILVLNLRCFFLSLMIFFKVETKKINLNRDRKDQLRFYVSIK